MVCPSWSDASVSTAITILSARVRGTGPVTLELTLNIIFCLPPKYILLLEIICWHLCVRMCIPVFRVSMCSGNTIGYRRTIFCFDLLNLEQCDNATIGPYAECEDVWVLISLRPWGVKGSLNFAAQQRSLVVHSLKPHARGDLGRSHF